jgi:DNA-binding CsgD family transcriptional regulator
MRSARVSPMRHVFLGSRFRLGLPSHPLATTQLASACGCGHLLHATLPWKNFPLAPSERRVAGMAAEGGSNRAIAQDLFLTVKTIAAHLSSAYRKLDIGSRSELPAARDLQGPYEG